MAARAGTKTKTKTRTKTKSAAKAKTATKPRATKQRKERRIASATAPIVLEFRDGRRTPIWKACSTDDSRPVLCHPWTKPEKKGTVVASKLTLTPKDATVQMFGADAFRQSWDRPDGAPIDLAKLIAGYLEGGLLEEYVVAFNPDVFAKTAAALGAGGPGFHPIIMRFCRTKDSDGPTGLRPMVLTVDQGGGKDAGKVRDLDSMAILMPIRVSR